MLKNPFFTAIMGLMLGLVVGYLLAEREAVPPAEAMRRAASEAPAAAQQAQQATMPPKEKARNVEEKAGRLRDLLAKNPEDLSLMTALGNLYFDASHWEESRIWYERVLEKRKTDANVETDLAVVYRNLQQPDRALALLEKVVREDPAHWQGWFNMAVVLHFDLHRHDEALDALKKLEALAKNDPNIPDLSSLATQIRS